MKSVHKILLANSNKMDEVEDGTIDLVVTSPPYPMIEMWDQQFFQMNPEISDALDRVVTIQKKSDFFEKKKCDSK